MKIIGSAGEEEEANATQSRDQRTSSHAPDSLQQQRGFIDIHSSVRYASRYASTNRPTSQPSSLLLHAPTIVPAPVPPFSHPLLKPTLYEHVWSYRTV